MSQTAAVAPKSAGEMIVAYFRDFRVLKETRREYWGIQIVNVLDCTFYFALITISTVFLSQDLGLNDKQAGFSVMLFTSGTSLMLFISGTCTDWLGIRRSLYVSMVGMLLLRLGVVVVGLTPSLPHRGILASMLLALMAPFMAGIQTVFQSSCQRYTTKRSRSAGFNLWYLFMNIGAAIAGFSVDAVREWLHVGNVHIFTMGVITAVLCLVVGATMVRREDQLVDANEPPETKAEEAKVEHKTPWRTFLAVVTEPTLWRLLVLVLLIVGVRAVYTYLYILMPKYWLRTIGPHAAIGTLSAINPIGIVIGLILFIPLANKFNVFSMLIYGAMVSAFSLFPMALPWGLFGHNISTAHYNMSILCNIILTIGEVVWSPKLYEYTALIAPKGQEGTYLGFSLLPWFLAKTIVSAISGYLLEYWCPKTVMVGAEDVPLQQAMIQGQVPYWHSPAAMWLILGLYAFAGCVIAILLRRWFEPPEKSKPKDDEPGGSAPS
jgi:proton-dependent oligopeptide transporter, POT family